MSKGSWRRSKTVSEEEFSDNWTRVFSSPGGGKCSYYHGGQCRHPHGQYKCAGWEKCTCSMDMEVMI